MDKSTNSFIASTLLLFLFSSSTIAAVGRTPGTADVTASGEAIYTIPISTPPGTNGMTPKLALMYSGRNRSTVAGVGWSIEGLSAISRCSKIWAADGEAREPRNDYTDRFCLDGNKLRLTSGGYGMAGASYQTELETFSRITSFGATGNGPNNFTVVDRDGVTYEYGNTADSRIEPVGQTTIRTWALNKIRDTSGNQITFTYAKDPINGAYRIDLIQYTANPVQGLASSYSVDFIWESKPVGEVDSGFNWLSIVEQIYRLDKIEVKYGATLVRRYELTYEGALSLTMKSRLASIQECAGATPECLSATTFTYQNATAGLSSEINTAVAVPTNPWPLDVNGDGRDDLVYSSSTTSGSGTWMVMFANGSGGYNTPINTAVTNTNYSGATPIDYNSDGFADLLVPYSGGTWWVMTGSTSGLSAPVNTSAPAPSTGTNAHAFDVDGDGRDDLVWAEFFGYDTGGDTVRYRVRTPGGPTGFSSTISTLLGPLPVDQKYETSVFGGGQTMGRRAPDFNGDGRGDVLIRRTRRVWVDTGGQTGFYKFFRHLDIVCPGAWASGTTNPNASSAPIYGDLNGDGKSDLLSLNQDGNIVARFSSGAGLTGEIVVASLGSYSNWIIFDWDGDGYDDILLAAPTEWKLVRSTGEGFAAAVSTGVSPLAQMISDINGDGLSDLGGSISSTWRFRLHAGVSADLLQTATDGFGNFATFNYTTIAQGNHTKNTGAVFPENDYQGALQIVSTLVANNGIGGSFTRSFWYYYARTHLQGRGFEGFGSRRTIDSRNGIQLFEDRAQLFPYTGMAKETVAKQADNTEMSRATHTLQTHSYGSGFETRKFPYVSQTTSSERDVAGVYKGVVIRTTSQTNLVDATTGVTYDTTMTVSEPATGANGVQPSASYVRRTYQPLVSLTTNPNCLGKPQEIQQIRSHNQFGGGAITRTTDITWDTTACRPTQFVVEPGHAQLQVTRTLGYDGFGNINSDSVTGIGMAARTTSANWGATGQFPTSVTNALAQIENNTWNYAFGMPASETDANGLVMSWVYDDFGRPVRENRPDGTATTWALAACTAPSFCGDSKLRYSVTTSLRNTANGIERDDLEYYDAFDRRIYDEPEFVDGSRPAVVTGYDALGRIGQRSAPYLTGGNVFWTTVAYDLLNRPTTITSPTSDSGGLTKTSAFSYEGLTTSVVDPLGKEKAQISNVFGAIARSMDHDGYYQSFDYDGFNNVLRVMDSLSNTLHSNTYNIRGMRTAQTDMDTGTWTYTPNALGEISSQTDAKSQSTTLVYDKLGRLTSRTEPEGISTFTFGTSAAAKNIGSLASMSGPGYSEAYTYDSVGRLQQRSITSDATYAFNFTYNTKGSLDTMTYPVSTASYRLKLQYDYQNGQLLRVKDFNAPATVFWQVNAVDAWGNIIDETLGNGIRTVRGFDLAVGALDYIQSGVGGGAGRQDLTYSWDTVGNLTQRQNIALGLAESFGYDNLHRLTSITGPEPRTIAYDAMGNITSKTSVGTYTYHATKKHQVTAAGSTTYGYDANGNMNSRGGSAISWYSYNLPNTISDLSSNSSQFFYAPDRARWKQVASYAGTSEQTIYIGGLVEKVTLGADTHWKHYIAGGTGIVAEHIRHSTGTNETVYLLKDHLGSTEMVTTASGNQMSRLSYDAWGRRRNGGGWSGNPAASSWTTITNTTRHGFTSHEMLDNLGLIHMNGRVFDPVLARFLSADPFVQAPGFTQSFNRYSYTSNNPLHATDPSGFDERGQVNWINHDAPPSPVDNMGAYGYTMGSNTFFSMGLVGGFGINVNPGGIGPRADLWSLRRDWTPQGAEPFPPGPGPGPTPTPPGGTPWSKDVPRKGSGDTISVARATFGKVINWAKSARADVNGLAENAVDYWIEQDAWYSPIMGTFAMSMTAEYDIQTVTALGTSGFGSLFMKTGTILRPLVNSGRFQSLARAYWKAFGPAGGRFGRSLHHWLFTQSNKWVPTAIKNGNWNLIELPGLIRTPFGGLNQWMGLSRSAWAPVTEWAIRIGILSAPPGAVYVGGQIGIEMHEDDDDDD